MIPNRPAGKLVTPIDQHVGSPAGWDAFDVAALTYPPDGWFTDETADMAPPKLTVTPEGQVLGVVAPAGRCLLDGQPGCWTVPRPVDGRGSEFDCPDDAELRLAHVGSTVLASGVEIPTGMLAGAGGHHTFFSTPKDPAKSEYADVGRAVARGRFVWSDQAGGLVFLGALMPTVDEVKAAVVRASACSIDYRWIPDEQRHVLYGACLVNLGGLPSRYTRPVMAGAATFIPDTVLAAVEALTVDYVIDGEPATGAMIALVPDDPDGLAVDGGEPADALHLTLRYLGSADVWPPEARTELVDLIDRSLNDGPPVGPVGFETAAVGVIGSKGAGALILNSEVGPLRQTLADLAEHAAATHAVPIPDDHPGFIPHLTVRYDNQPPAVSRIGSTFTASTLRVVFADEAYDFPLSPTKEPTMTAAACSCQEPKQAAYRLVDEPPTPTNAQVVLPDGRTGQVDAAVTGLDGTRVLLIQLVIDGKLADWNDRIAVPETEVSFTGKSFEWTDDTTGNIVLAAATLEQMSGPGLDDVAAKLDTLTAAVADIAAQVADLHRAALNDALAEQPLPPLP